MAKEEVILETIKRMRQSGIEDNAIIETLQDIGITEEEAQGYIEKISSKKPPAPAEKPEVSQIAEKTAEKVKEHLDEAKREDDVHKAMTQNAIQEQNDKINEVHEKIDRLHEKIPNGSEAAAGSNEALEQIKELKEEITDLKAMTQATKELMEKILEVNRKILIK